MKRKLFLILLIVVLTVCAAIIISSCDYGTAHNFGEWIIEKEPTCTQVGQKYRTCTDDDCNYLEWEAIPATGHNFSGYADYNEMTHTLKCAVCGTTGVAENHAFENSICKVCKYNNNPYGLQFKLIVGGYELTGVSNGCNILIPDSYDSLPVISIGSYAFYGCSNLQSVTIPSSVTSIGDSAFERCGSLTSIKIPNGVTSIGEDAFRDCYRLTSIKILSSVISIGANVFNNCFSLTIYCEAEKKPSEWSSSWNNSNRPVVWGYKEQDEVT